MEKKTLNDYIKITTDFLQGVFDNVVPQRKATVYSRTGALVKNQPQSMILNMMNVYLKLILINQILLVQVAD